MRLGDGDKYVVFLLLLSSLVIMAFTGCQTKGTSRDSEKAGKDQTDTQVRSEYFSSEKVTPKVKEGKVTYQIGVDAYQGANKVRFWLPYPVSNKNQNITDIIVNGNYSSTGIYTEGEYGNTILYAEWEEPQSRPELSFSFKVKREEIVKKDFPENEESSIPPETEKFLAASDFVPTSGECKEIAEEETKDKKSPLGKAEAIYDHLVEKYQRDDNIVGCGIGDVSESVASKKGKCADIHSVFVGLTRSVGVPAKEIFGIRMPSEDGDMTKAFHCRAEFYHPSYGWVPVDASDVLKLMLKENLSLDDEKTKEARSYYFGAQTETYIDFGTGRDLVLNPPQEGGKLNYFMYPYAEVDGKPLDYLSQQDLKYTVTFESL